jgi:hypothetical protein
MYLPNRILAVNCRLWMMGAANSKGSCRSTNFPVDCGRWSVDLKTMD